MVSSSAILSPLYNARAVTTPATPCTGARGRNFLRLGRAAARHGAPGLRRRPDPDQGDRGKLVRNDWGSSLRPGHTPWFGSWLGLSASDGQRPIGWTPSCSSGGSWGGCVGNGAIAARCAFRLFWRGGQHPGWMRNPEGGGGQQFRQGFTATGNHADVNSALVAKSLITSRMHEGVSWHVVPLRRWLR